MTDLTIYILAPRCTHACLAISGIMVDGIDVDERVLLTRLTKCMDSENIGHTCEKCEGSFREAEQNLNDADMVVILKSNTGTRHIRENQEIFYDQIFEAYAIYGNRMIKTHVMGHQISDSDKNTKVVWANQKPYILNGDQTGKPFIALT